MAIAVSVQPSDEVRFGPFRLDVEHGCLWRDGEVVTLRAKIWRLLCVFAANPGRLLSKDELIDIVWEGTAVGDTLPNVSVTELRRVLGDDAKDPRYIQTVHGRGFRFIAAIQQPEASSLKGVRPSPLLVGRERELDLLESVLDRDSDCRVGFVLGEAGIGKTSLLNALLERGGSAGGIVGRGQCVAHFGEVYPYLALLGALEDMCRRDERVLKSLRTIAPTWLARLPGLIPIEEHEALHGQSNEWVPSTAIDQLIALQEDVGGVVWAIEDLHWAGHTTVEALGILIERAPRSTCCVVATYRLAEAIVSAHPLIRLRRELRRRQRCREVLLEGLNGADVREYLALRHPANRFPDWLPERLLTRTGGNPFFLTSTLDHLISAGALDLDDEDGSSDCEDLAPLIDEIPPTLRDSLREQIDEVDPAERRLLDAASIGGLKIDAAMIAAALGEPVVAVDAACTTLSRHSPILQRIGETVWPDGTASGSYQFRHVLYPEVLYDEQSPAARREAHGRIARALAAGFSETAREAPTIAHHFECAGDNDEAITHHIMAAHLSNERFASKEAVWHLRRALPCCRRGPTAPMTGRP